MMLIADQMNCRKGMVRYEAQRDLDQVDEEREARRVEVKGMKVSRGRELGCDADWGLVSM